MAVSLARKSERERRRLEPYPTYEHSGVEWLAEIGSRNVYRPSFSRIDTLELA